MRAPHVAQDDGGIRWGWERGRKALSSTTFLPEPHFSSL